MGKCKIAPPVIIFDRDMLQQQIVANIQTIKSLFKNCKKEFVDISIFHDFTFNGGMLLKHEGIIER